ncbi:hypothetical protein BH09CHL1_BH09CHL1_03520 [soil metagenome]
MAQLSTDQRRALMQSRPRPNGLSVGTLTRWLPLSLWPLAAVVLVYVAATFIIPTDTPVSISDDWTYILSVQNLVNQGRVDILSISAATMVFQLFWGGAFAFLFGMTFGVLRVSTIVITLLGSFAVFGMCRELGVTRQMSALGVAVYLFNPVLFSITYTFMTDPHYLALLTISSYFYVRGMRPDAIDDRAIVAGSIFAALGCLQRPHAALIPFALVLYLIAARRINLNREGVNLFLKVVAIPAATFLLYYVAVARGLPSQQGKFVDDIRAVGINQGAEMTKRLAGVEAVYIGFYLLPLAICAIPLVWKLSDYARPRAYLIFTGFMVFMVGEVVALWKEGRRMPYIPHFFGTAGPGSTDVRGSRMELAGQQAWDLLTVICVIAAAIAALAIIREFSLPANPGRSAAAAFAFIGFFQAVGTIPQSISYRGWIISLDRYLLPMVPFLIALFLWSIRNYRFAWQPAWLITIAIGIFSIMGTRDALVFQETAWNLGKWLNSQGVPNTMIDAGFSWDGYHVWELGDQEGLTESRTPDPPWWVATFAKATDSTYVVSGRPIPGYTAIAIQPYSTWLHESHQYLYVYRRDSHPGPP